MSIGAWLTNLLQRLFFQWRYFSSPPWDTGISPPELFAFIDTHSAGRALDLGCGTGTNAITLAEAGWEVIGVDFIGSAISIARQKAKNVGEKVQFLQADVTRLKNIIGPFDLILDIGCFHSLSQARKPVYIKQLVELLAPQGVFLLYGFISVDQSEHTGIQKQDLLNLEHVLECIQRVDGKDRKRSSAWFTYQLRH